MVARVSIPVTMGHRKQTWYGVTIVGLYFMLGTWHILDKFLHTLNTLTRISVPCQGRRGAIKLGEIIHPCRGVIRGVIQTCKRVSCSCRDLDAIDESV
jgi:hypothetical protein